jgi:hypothetical protein
VDTNGPKQSPDREPVSEAEVRSALLRLLRLLAAEVAKRLPAPNAPGRDRPAHDARTTQAGFSSERDRLRTSDPKGQL